jgi:hypothetical protein
VRHPHHAAEFLVSVQSFWLSTGPVKLVVDSFVQLSCFLVSESASLRLESAFFLDITLFIVQTQRFATCDASLPRFLLNFLVLALF